MELPKGLYTMCKERLQSSNKHSPVENWGKDRPVDKWRHASEDPKRCSAASVREVTMRCRFILIWPKSEVKITDIEYRQGWQPLWNLPCWWEREKSGHCGNGSAVP